MASDPFVLFYGDHQAIRARLRAFEKALDAAMNRDRAEASDLAVFRETLDFLRTSGFAHLRREEHGLLPPLEARVGRFGTLVNVIAYDHDEIRREVAKFGESLVTLEAAMDRPHRAELHEVNRHGIFLVQYMGLHMAKEDSSLAALAREALGEAGIQEVARRLEEVR